MKVKTSVSLSNGLLQAIDGLSGLFQNRSSFLEAAAWDYLARLKRVEEEARDIEIINRHADELNSEMLDVLEYQVPL